MKFYRKGRFWLVSIIAFVACSSCNRSGIGKSSGLKFCPVSSSSSFIAGARNWPRIEIVGARRFL